MSEQIAFTEVEKAIKGKWDLVQSPVIVERHDIHGARHYAPTEDWWEDNGEGERPLFKSITTIPQALDKGVGFYKFYGNSPSFELANEYAKERANIGTIVHVLVTDLLLGDKIIFDELALLEHPDLKEYENIQKVYRRNKKEIIKYLMSFKQFWIERDPAPLALEIPMLNPKKNTDGSWMYKFAGTADFIGHFIGKYNKVAFASLDWKTGKEYPEHQLQLTASKILWDSFYPEQPIDVLASVYLKSGWRTKPSYTIKYHKFEPAAWAGVMLADELQYYLNHKGFELGDEIMPKFPTSLPDSIELADVTEK